MLVCLIATIPSLSSKLPCIFLNATLGKQMLSTPGRQESTSDGLGLRVSLRSSTIPVNIPWRPIPVPYPRTSTSPPVVAPTRSTSHARVRCSRAWSAIVIPESIIDRRWDVSSSVIVLSSWRQIVVSSWWRSTVVGVVWDVGVDFGVLRSLGQS